MEKEELLMAQQLDSIVSRSQYLRLYESIECVVDLPDLDQCEFIPLPFDYSDTSICERIPTDPSVTYTGYIDEEQIVVLGSANGNFLDQQRLVVWKSLPDEGNPPEVYDLDWWYFFMVNRPQRAIIKWRVSTVGSMACRRRFCRSSSDI